MLNSGKKNRAFRDIKYKYYNSCVVRKKNSERKKKIITPPPPFKLHGRSLSTCRFNRRQTIRAFCIFCFVLGSYFS